MDVFYEDETGTCKVLWSLQTKYHYIFKRDFVLHKSKKT